MAARTAPKLTTIDPPQGEHWPKVGPVQIQDAEDRPGIINVLIDGERIGTMQLAQRPSLTRTRGPVRTWQPHRYKIDHRTYTKRWEAVRVIVTDHLGY